MAEGVPLWLAPVVVVVVYAQCRLMFLLWNVIVWAVNRLRKKGGIR
jgi:hypothetical protein